MLPQKQNQAKKKTSNKRYNDVANPTRNQQGSVSFGLYHSIDNPSVIIGFERWASKEEHEQHLRGEHVRKLMSAMKDILAEPPQILSYEVIDE